MAAPTGINKEIYASPVKQCEMRFKIRLDRPIAASNFVDEFGGASIDTALWSYIKPPNTSITVGGGKLTLASTAPTNGFPSVSSMPQAFPEDKTIGWTLEWTMDYPSITSSGVFFAIADLQNNEPIVFISNNSVDGYSVSMPGNTELENLGTGHTTSHDYQLIYTPATNIVAAQYELKRDGVSKGTLAAAGRQAWMIFIGNSSIQTDLVNWTSIAVSRVDVNLVSAESYDWPDWTDREQSGSQWWGRLPWAHGFSLSSDKNNELDTATLTLSQGGFVTGIPGQGSVRGLGWRDNMFAGFRWQNREIRAESRMRDGKGRWTPWLEVFRGLCDEPTIAVQNNQAMLNITIREKVRRHAQMSHVVRSYSDAGTAIDGVQMNKNVQAIIQDLLSLTGLAASDYNVAACTIKPRTWQILGEPALDDVMRLADEAALAAYRNAGTSNPGRLEIQEWDWGSETPDFYLSPDEAVVSIEWTETVFGLTGQVLITVQHSEFGEFSDTFPSFPSPPFAAVIRRNVAIAQTATDINTTRLLPFLHWKVANRDLNSLKVYVVGQDWFEHNLECQVTDFRNLRIEGEYYIVDGWEYNWTPQGGFLTTLHLVNQNWEKAIMRARLDKGIAVTY